MTEEHNHYQDDRLQKVENKCNSQDTVINGVCTDMSFIKADVSWLKKIMWWLLTFVVGTAIMELINLGSYIISRR